MKIVARAHGQAGYALLLVMLFTTGALIVLASVLKWSSAKAFQTSRQNQFSQSICAAEAAVEKAGGRMSSDYQNLGSSALDNNLSTYRSLIPTSADAAQLGEYQFMNSQASPNVLDVTRLMGWAYYPLTSTFSGLQGRAATYRLTAFARNSSSAIKVAEGVQADLQFASIPIFQYAAFYAQDLEICPGGNLGISGRIHSNQNIYLQPAGTLTIDGRVTAANGIFETKSPLDPSSRTLGTIVYNSERNRGLKTLNVPVGMDTSPAALHQLLEWPPSGESSTSLIGQQRYCNKADMIILINDSGWIARSGAYNGFATILPGSLIDDFLKTDITFFNKRENKTVRATQIDIGRMNGDQSALSSYLGRVVRTLWIWDYRSQTTSTESGVRLVNGQNLPSWGLTVATPNPLYVLGHYNAPGLYLGTTNTSTTYPASLVADAVTFLSRTWSDRSSSSSLSSRHGDNTTYNAAVLTGIVPSGGGYYSGGYENAIRLLEDWSSRTMTFNGSIVVLFNSQIATAPWGASGDVYIVPSARNWSFDQNFLDMSKLPPSTPELRTTIRARWTNLAMRTR